MRSVLFCVLLGCGVALWGQSPDSSNSPSSNSPSSNSQAADSASSPAQKASAPRHPDLAPPRSDSVNAGALAEGKSSSKDNEIDLSPPADDAKTHPRSSDVLKDEGTAGGDLSEFHPWNPHKAAKDIEVGDFYFKRRNYRAAEDRYREALFYKDNDAIATFRLAVCLEKENRPEESREAYENYLKILPHGPQAEDAQKALERLSDRSAVDRSKRAEGATATSAK